MAKNQTYNKLIHTTRWLKLRRAVLNAHPVCQMCEAERRVSAATEAHHIVPCETALTESEMERLMFDPHNIMALCHYHHRKVHEAMGKGGKKGNRIRANERLQNFVKKFLSDEAGEVF